MIWRSESKIAVYGNGLPYPTEKWSLEPDPWFDHRFWDMQHYSSVLRYNAAIWVSIAVAVFVAWEYAVRRYS